MTASHHINVTFLTFKYIICVCVMTYVLSIHTVSSLKTPGMTCSSSGECISNVYCISGTCGCRDGFHYNSSSSSCFQMKTLGMTCSTHVECISNLYCISGTCECQNDLYYNSSSRSCFQKKSQGAICSSTTECTSNFICSSGTCSCVGDFYYSSSRSCLPMKTAGMTCSYDTECISNVYCISGKCECRDDLYYNSSSRYCFQKKSQGAICSSTTECTSNFICSSGTCRCVGDFYYNSSRSCLPKKSQGAICSSSTECTSNFMCSSGTCRCVGDFYSNSSRSCLPMKTAGVTCSSNGECISNVYCISGTCECRDGLYYSSSARYCFPMKTFGMNCSVSQECTSNLHCISGTCQCDDEAYYIRISAACYQKKSQGAVCSSTTECTSNFICSSGTCRCVGDFYSNSPRSCLPRKTRGTGCTSATECTSNLTCTSSICDCDGDFYYNSPSRSCLRKRDHGAVCQSSLECKPPNTVCTSYPPHNTNKCLCASGFYWTNYSSCIAQINLKITATVITRETRTVIFVWHGVSQRTDVSYSIKWNGSNKLNAAETGVPVPGLQPGTLYNFAVLSSLPGDENYPSITVEQPQAPLWTRPDRPGPVIDVRREANSIYRITFGQSDGNVYQYTMSVSTGGSVIETQSSTSTVMYFIKLKPATTYFYVLESYNGNAEDSDPTSGSFTTDPEASGPVLAFSYRGVQSDTAKVTWQPPSEPNGNITGYLVEVALQNTSECLYYIMVPCHGCDDAALNVSAPNCTLKEAYITISSHEYNLQLPNLTPYLNYTAIVRAINERGLGEQASVTFQTYISASEEDDELPVGAIVGGVLGGLALIAVIGVIVCLIRKVQSRKEIREPVRENADTQVTRSVQRTPKQTSSERIELPQLQENSQIYEEIEPSITIGESASSVRYTQQPRRLASNVRPHRGVRQGDIRESQQSPYENVNCDQDDKIYVNYSNKK